MLSKSNTPQPIASSADVVAIINESITSRSIVRGAKTCLKLREQVRVLDNDIMQLKTLSKDNIRSLEHLHCRVLSMRNSFLHTDLLGALHPSDNIEIVHKIHTSANIIADPVKPFSNGELPLLEFLPNSIQPFKCSPIEITETWSKLKKNHEYSHLLNYYENEERIHSIYPEFRLRISQYEHKMKKLEDEVNFYKNRRIHRIGQLSFISHKLKTVQYTIDGIIFEMDRIMPISANKMVKSSLFGGMGHLCKVSVLKTRLDNELKKCEKMVIAHKVNILQLNSMIKDDCDFEFKRKQQLQDRISRFATFKHNIDNIVKLNKKIKQQSDLEIKHEYFSILLANARRNKACRNAIQKIKLFLDRLLLSTAMRRWYDGKRDHYDIFQPQKIYSIVSKGDRHLCEVVKEKLMLKKDADEMIKFMNGIKKEFILCNYTSPQLKVLKCNKSFGKSELGGLLIKKSMGIDTSYLLQAISKCMNENELVILATVYGRLGNAYYGLDKTDHAMVMHQKQMQLAEKLNHKPYIACALEGIARGHLKLNEHDKGMVFLRNACKLQSDMGDMCAVSRLVNLLYTICSQTDVRLLLDELNLNSCDFENGYAAKLNRGKNMLDDYRNRLIYQCVSNPKVVALEQVSQICIDLRLELKNLLEIEKESAQKYNKAQQQHTFKAEEPFHNIGHAPQNLMPQKNHLILHDDTSERNFCQEHIHLQSLAQIYQEHHSEEKAISQLLSNIKEKIFVLKNELKVEEGELMQKAIANRTVIQFLALNSDKGSSREMSIVASATCQSIMLHNIFTGELLHIIETYDKTRKSTVITCIALYKSYVFCGQSNGNIQVWNASKHNCINILKGHCSSVCCIAAHNNKAVSGGADKSINVWDIDRGCILHRLEGYHHKSVTCISIEDDKIASGGADGLILYWSLYKDSYECRKFPPKNNDEISSQCSLVLCAVTSISFGPMELLSGHSDGAIIIWWINTGAVLRKIHAHSGPVKSLYFDASKIVTGSLDKTVAVFDISTGELLIRLYEHKQAVLSVSFDSTKIISSSTDGTIWWWELKKNLFSNEMESNRSMTTMESTSNLNYTRLLCNNSKISISLPPAMQKNREQSLSVKTFTKSAMEPCHKLYKMVDDFNEETGEENGLFVPHSFSKSQTSKGFIKNRIDYNHKIFNEKQKVSHRKDMPKFTQAGHMHLQKMY